MRESLRVCLVRQSRRWLARRVAKSEERVTEALALRPDFDLPFFLAVMWAKIRGKKVVVTTATHLAASFYICARGYVRFPLVDCFLYQGPILLTIAEICACRYQRTYNGWLHACAF